MLLVKFSGIVLFLFGLASSVPQVFHLGCFLFNIFLNDMVDVGLFKIDCLLFANDITVFTSAPSFSDSQRLQMCPTVIEDSGVTA